MYGDLRFHSARRLFLEQFIAKDSSSYNSAFTYLYSYKDPGRQPDEGTPHGADLDCVWQSTKSNKACPQMAQYWINFINSKNPNARGQSEYAEGEILAGFGIWKATPRRSG